MAKYNDTRFYWLQLKEDFFDDDAIEWLESQDNGPAYALFYLKLCLKALKTNGILIRKVGDMLIPYDAQKLAKLTSTPVDTVKSAMVYLKRSGLIDILENGEIFIGQLSKLIGSQSVSAFKKQQQRILREKALELPEGNGKPTEYLGGGQEVDRGVDICPPELELELEQEIEIEKDTLASDDAPFTLTGEGVDDKKSDSVPYSDIVMLYNDLARDKLPQVTKLNDARRKAIAARWKEGNRLEAFETVFKKAVSSEFLLGKTGGTFRASFDWLLSPKNFLKTLEGNYDNKPKKGARNNDTAKRDADGLSDAERIERENERTRKWLEERTARARQLQQERERLEASRGVHEHNQE